MGAGRAASGGRLPPGRRRTDSWLSGPPVLRRQHGSSTAASRDRLLLVRVPVWIWLALPRPSRRADAIRYRQPAAVQSGSEKVD